MTGIDFDFSSAYFSGTSNVVLPVANKQHFPEDFKQKSRLTYYASLFNSVEVNSTFYKLPLPQTVARWATETPETFRFTFKLWKDITHNKSLAFSPGDVYKFMHIINFAGDRRGCVLLQLPPATTVNISQLSLLLATLKQADVTAKWKIAVEFRHRSWYTNDVFDLLDDYGAGLVIHDLPASAAPLRVGDADFAYLRFHGPQGGYRGSYTDDFLQEYSTYIKEWIADEKTVYAYFNNTMGSAVHNLGTLNKYVN
ncbi:DUF72 domain-containing protein [Mucilaginibacter aquatilis]|uniref:DUF72 domain-containing protein n=1 Tax=Mucilaginibacter aquatilis TaxID=1517760 RepID=A0A6I4IRN2_9SPHI|nr:DUF72 domain-containing protein [Mucilaginibacter aquatilis]MVN93154.1 DUF72 domain-containing protein [Mucilaginibacter aquatilis]